MGIKEVKAYKAECDECGEDFVDVDNESLILALFKEDLKSQVVDADWLVSGEEILCPDCADNKENESEEDEEAEFDDEE